MILLIWIIINDSLLLIVIVALFELKIVSLFDFKTVAYVWAHYLLGEAVKVTESSSPLVCISAILDRGFCLGCVYL